MWDGLLRVPRQQLGLPWCLEAHPPNSRTRSNHLDSLGPFSPPVAFLADPRSDDVCSQHVPDRSDSAPFPNPLFAGMLEASSEALDQFSFPDPATRRTVTCGSGPILPIRSTAAIGASRSSRFHSPSRAAGAPMELRSSARTGSSPAPLDQESSAFPSRAADPSPKAPARSASTTLTAKSHWLSLYILHPHVVNRQNY